MLAAARSGKINKLASLSLNMVISFPVQTKEIKQRFSQLHVWRRATAIDLRPVVALKTKSTAFSASLQRADT
jgi:hypothetical protein